MTGPVGGPGGPGRIAVALHYDGADAPRVVATGQGWLGEKIVETAREHGVPIEENPALAQALSTIEVDEEIPESLYRAIAEVLSFLLKPQ